jgi:hypothetical protein
MKLWEKILTVIDEEMANGAEFPVVLDQIERAELETLARFSADVVLPEGLERMRKEMD